MNPKEAILKIKALFEDMPKQEEAPVEEVKAAEFAEYVLADGTKVMVSSLEVGGEVKLEDGSNAPDGDHQLADGTQISTLDGKIVEIEVAEKPEQENVDVEVESKKMDKKMEEMAAEFQAKISDMEILNAALMAKIEALENKSKSGFAQVVELIEEMSKVPQADPIEKPQAFKFETTKDIKFDRLNKYRNAILNNKN
jgi:hypothetical protein